MKILIFVFGVITPVLFGHTSGIASTVSIGSVSRSAVECTTV